MTAELYILSSCYLNLEENDSWSYSWSSHQPFCVIYFGQHNGAVLEAVNAAQIFKKYLDVKGEILHKDFRHFSKTKSAGVLNGYDWFRRVQQDLNVCLHH